MGSSPDAMPYWHVNVPESEREEQCPDFLRSLSEKDERIISTPDDEYRICTWPEVQKIILQNRIDLFQRQPSDLRRYLANNWKIKQDHGSVMNFVLTQRLKWTEPVVARGRPFEFDDDIKILYNDWPYGIDERIVHLVIWTKFDLAENPETGDLSDEARSQIQTYVDRTFLPSVPAERFIWFKNWRSLKSVHALEHFHVMLYDPPPQFLHEITQGDVPLCKRPAA